jgi:hypothetical protein
MSYNQQPTSGYNNANTGNSYAATAADDDNFYDTSLYDLGNERYELAVADASDRDHAIMAQAPIHVAAGRAPQGLEQQVFAWNTLQYTDEDKDVKVEALGDLHAGQLHRANRAAVAPPPPGPPGMGMGMNGGGGGRGRGGRGGRGRGGGRGGAMARDPMWDPLIAGRKPSETCPPQAKGFPEELDKSLFWDGPIC